MFTMDKATICKSLNPRELSFYKNIPDDMKPFTPTCRGKYCDNTCRWGTFYPISLLPEHKLERSIFVPFPFRNNTLSWWAF